MTTADLVAVTERKGPIHKERIRDTFSFSLMLLCSLCY